MQLWSILKDATPFSLAILAVLALGSLLSWTVIFERASFFSRARRAGADFARLAASVGSLEELLQLARHHPGALAARSLSQAAQSMPTTEHGSSARWEQRLQSTGLRELDQGRRYFSLLATMSAASPFVGLLGTVWGVMIAFLRIGSSQGQAMLEVVGPGIAEALIATVAGLATAIPATVAYNFFLAALRKQQRFIEDAAGQLLILAADKESGA